MRLSAGGRPRKTGTECEPVPDVVTLKELGLTKRESSQAQQLAKMADERPDLWEALLAGSISQTAAFKEWKGPQPKTAGSMKGLYAAVIGATNDYFLNHSLPWDDVETVFALILEDVRRKIV